MKLFYSGIGEVEPVLMEQADGPVRLAEFG